MGLKSIAIYEGLARQNGTSCALLNEHQFLLIYPSKDGQIHSSGSDISYKLFEENKDPKNISRQKAKELIDGNR